MSLEKAVVQVCLSGPHMRWLYPWVFPVVGSSTPCKAMAPPLRSPLYGWPVRVSAEGTCGLGCVWGDPRLVVGLGVVLVDCLEVLWAAPSEVLGGRYCAAAWGAAQ